MAKGKSTLIKTFEKKIQKYFEFSTNIDWIREK